MVTARPLKVYRTPIGFHDAYVAAPSKAAALRAWGAGRDLFAGGAAEEVTDPALVAEPLAHPGTIVRRSRGTAAEQLAASPRPARTPTVRVQRSAPAPEPEPEPDRAALAQAEQALADVDRRTTRTLHDLDERAALLARERQAAERTARDERRRHERTRERAARAYDAAMARWREAAEHQGSACPPDRSIDEGE